MDYTPLEVDEYKQRFYDANEKHLLLDVRTVEEFDGIRIPGAVNIPLDILHEHVHEISGDQPIVVVCRSGIRSIMGSQILRYTGLKDTAIYNLEGGTKAWAGRGWETESS